MKQLIGMSSAGLSVLDLGCGSGFLIEWLIDQGAAYVCGIDGSSAMINIARSRPQPQTLANDSWGSTNKWGLRVHDLNSPLRFLEDNTFDLVISSLTFHYVRDWHHLLGDCNRVLNPGSFNSSQGTRLITSTHPPVEDDTWGNGGSGNYFASERLTWGGDAQVAYYRRPLSQISTALHESGFVIERIVEPTPVTEAKGLDLERFQRLSRVAIYHFVARPCFSIARKE